MKRIGLLSIGALLALLTTAWLSADGSRPLIEALCYVHAGTSAPESSRTAGICDLYTRSGTAGLYLKETGTGNTGWGQVVTLANTVTLTNKTLSAEGTGNVVTIPFTDWIPAARCDNATPTSPRWSFPTSNPGVPVCQTGTNTQFGTMDFADGANALSAQTHVALPADWTGAVDVRVKWLTSAIAGSVVWQVATICVANAETADPVFNTASTVTDAALGTTLQTNDAAIAGVTTTGCEAGELMFVKVTRDPANGSDSLAATASLIGIEFVVRRAI